MKILYHMFLLLFLLPFQANAATCGGLNPVLVTASGLAFGNYGANSPNDKTSNASISVFCTIQLSSTLPSFSISISAGNSNSFTSRQMNFLASTLNYNIYTTDSFSSIWGDGTGGSVTQSYNSNAGLSLKEFTAYGKIPTQQYVPVGVYGDLLLITVTY